MESGAVFFRKNFPKTPEEFDRAEVIHNWMVRIDLVRWMNAILEVYTNHPNKENLAYYGKIMMSSHDKTNYLFKIQAAINLKAKISINVEPGNFYYNILLEAHQLWNTLTLQFVIIFVRTNVIHDHEYIFQLLQMAPRAIGGEILNLIAENESLMEITNQLKDNLNTIVSHIQSYEASQ